MGRKRIVDRFLLSNAEETRELGAYFGSLAQPNSVFALCGQLGAGKTTFMQGFLQGLKIQDLAQSPTFTLMQRYSGEVPVYHFDLYRMESEAEFLRLGLDEYLQAEGIAAIEWPERIHSLIPAHALLVDISYADFGRIAIVKKWQDR